MTGDATIDAALPPSLAVFRASAVLVRSVWLRSAEGGSSWW